MSARAPFQHHSATSCEAARLMAPHLSSMEVEILNLITESQAAGGNGLTDDELITSFGTQSARPRRIFLVACGKVCDSGATRLTRTNRKAVVWRIA